MEYFIALCVGAFIYFIIVICLNNKGEKIDVVKRRLDSINNIKKSKLVIDEDMSKSIMDRLIKPMIKSFAEKLSRFMPGFNVTDNTAGKSNQTNKLKRMLMQGGFSIDVVEYSVIRILVIIGIALIFSLIGIVLKVGWTNVLMFFVIGILFGYTIMRYFLSMKISKRRMEIEQQLPEVLDLLSVSVEAGMGFEQAIKNVTKNIEGSLIDELTVTYREMAMGRTRKDALILLGERCDIEDIKSFAGALVQAGQMGISIKTVLQSQAAAMRQSRKAKIQEKASKVSVKILIPMILFILPVVFIVLLGPAVVIIMKTLG